MNKSGDVRNEQADSNACPCYDESHSNFAQDTRETREFAIFDVGDGNEEEEQGDEDTEYRNKDSKARKTSCRVWIGDLEKENKWKHIHGPTSNLAWNEATAAIQHIARKLKKASPMWNMIAGLEMIICRKRERTR